VETFQPSGNLYNKYETRRFLERIAVKGFIMAFRKLLGGFQLSRVLDVGCGEGYLTHY
jgi:2-polyprenyl-3-methyl-5-hydroxy-6-metoxy-1,4-benzoquinol methylase